MLKTFKNSFTQASLGSIIWITLLASIHNLHQTIKFQFIWNIIFIGLLLGTIFGVVYPYLWNYSTFKPSLNILISSTANLLCMYLGLKLYSGEMLTSVTPYWMAIIILTFIGHIIGFYFYSNYHNKRLEKELNQLI